MRDLRFAVSQRLSGALQVARAETATALQHVAAARAAEAAAVGRLQHVQEFAALRAAEAEAKGAPGAADDRRAAKVLADVAELQAQLAAAQRAQQVHFLGSPYA